MSRFTKLDSMLISEAYSAQLLSESAPHMTIAEIQSKLPYMTIAEAQIIEELFGKLGQKIGQVGAGLGNLAGAAGKGLKSVGQSAMGAVDRGIQSAVDVGKGVAGAASNVAQNVSNMYRAGVGEKEAAQAIEKAQASIEEIVNLINTAKSKYGPGSTFNKYFSDDPMKMTLQTISNQLNMASQTAQDINTDVKDRGFFGGSKAAYSAAKQGMSAPQGAPVVP